MKNELFRKENLDRIASPEQLDDYIRVSNPSVWVVLAAFAILLVGICVWGIFGKLDTKLSVAAVKKDDSIVCCVRESDYGEVGIGMPVVIGETEYTVTAIETEPVQADTSLSEYARHLGELTGGEWVYYVHTDCPADLGGEAFSAEIVIERVNPLYFVTN